MESWVLVGQPALVAAVFLLVGGAAFAALRRAQRRGSRRGAAGVIVFGVSCVTMAGVFAFVAAFYAITG